MRRSLLLIFMFSFIAAAQTMVGLPAIGVNLTGNEAAPLLTNTSSKAVFAIVVRSAGDNPGVETIWFAFNPVQPNELPRPLRQNIVTHSSNDPSVSTEMSLDAVVFEDGSFIGPDISGSYSALERQIAAFVNTGSALINASDKVSAWTQIEAQRKLRPTNPNLPPTKEARGEAFALQIAAASLMNARVRSGDDAAMALVAKFLSLGNLHKEN